MQQLALAFETVEQMFVRVFRVMKPRTEPPEISVEFYRYANINSTIRLDAGHRRIRVRISDLIETAPAVVQEALAYILLAKLYRKPPPEQADAVYREWSNSPFVRKRAGELRRERGRKRIFPAKGKVHNLNSLFRELNEQYFESSLRKPKLGWSMGKSKRLLGHYDPAHDAIVISRVFDDEKVPRFLLEYVLYHEMLHVKYPTEFRRQRRCVHTREFKAEERRFPRFAEANRMLHGL